MSEDEKRKSGGGIRRLVLDVLKLHDPSIVSFALMLEKINGVNAVNCTLVEVDSKTENLKVIIEGTQLNYESIQENIEKFHGSVHSVDQVVSGKRIVEEVETPQD